MLKTLNDLKELFGEETYCVVEAWTQSRRETIIHNNLSLEEAKDMSQFEYEQNSDYNRQVAQECYEDLTPIGNFKKIGYRREI